eukprot:TRINITY_DN10381_c0_g1_i1.p1 TRINITY_DN10381_c0_g1~~TRINITY_DN10381_c0_g1_i1.p1  ORF type:complete len:289 (-),score=59.31 TRINITY_DN10381_c0_g1_i1:106-849(-)
MTYGAAWVALKDKNAFEKHGYMDSKQLKAIDRERLFEKIRESPEIHWKITNLSAADISIWMQSRAKVNLNLMSHNTAIDLIQYALDQGFNITEVYVDAVGRCAPYQRKLNRLFPGIKCTVAEKADDLYPVVSAASICAKVIRDMEIHHHVFPEENITKRNFGSGYFADPKAKKWWASQVEPIFGFPDLVRFSYRPSLLAMEKGCAKVKWCRYAEDDDEEADAQQGRLKFATRYRYFDDNDMDIVTDF